VAEKLYGLWNFIVGYVIIELHGLGLERLINRAVESGIRLENLRRASYTLVRVRVRLTEYFRLKRLAGDKVTLRVCRAGGMARAFWFIKKRWWLALGCVVVVAAITLVSSLCLEIRINGLKTINEYDVYRTIQENGGRRFVFKNAVDLDRIETALRLEYPLLSYSYAEFDGVWLVVTLDEGSPKPELLPTDPADVLAKKAGIITRLTVGEGKAAVEVGDKVAVGDVLIRGVYDNGEINFAVSARGSVIARVDYVAAAQAAYQAKVLTPTGRAATERWMRLGGRLVKLSGENPFSLFESESRVVAELGSNMPVHAEIVEVTYREAVWTYTEENRQKAIIEAREAAYYKALQDIPEDVAVEEFRFHVTDRESAVEVTATLTVLEEIGERQPIGETLPPEQES